eukprot:CAMPEP_0197485672 /NCGR_PEP_ID=MMETSP1311-20131121/599_1 /TAXON_ID=464262 /ORGANISM="Genus nov. species nov., Strain RCC856" /LENGTH=385 /DNA_ID=CAMNT_0043028397 /DNA_START=151 /DNA_END=1308 /DNA_ORIENTATION=-
MMHLATAARLATGCASTALKAPSGAAPKSLLLANALARTPKLPASSALSLHHSQGFSTRAERKKAALERRYHWIEPEAERLIARAYARHRTLQQRDQPSPNGWTSFPPSISLKDLESDAIEQEYHYEPKTRGDKIAKTLVYYGEQLMHLFFRDKYDHHAVTLETIAAVPGVVGAAHRHLRSLRCMKRDHGWINPLQEEAENERMHLLIWMQHTKPTRLERAFVICAQGLYVAAYSVLMYLSPRTAHRTVGYLEEAAHRAYTDYLRAVDEGKIPNVSAGEVAKTYYRLDDSATLRDVILHVRADECMHRDFNHHLGDLYDNNEADEFPTKMDETMGLEEGQAAESSEEKSGRKAGKGRKRQSAATAEAAAATAGYSTQAAASNKNE